MRPPKTEKLTSTAFDAIAIALSPALIIGMVGSLVSFLVVAFYQGNYDTRLMVILGLFTMGTVLIARISIEQGRTYANGFALPLAIVAVIAMMRFVTVSGVLAPIGWIINVGLLALTWFLADRITHDCTLIEEDRESLQSGLLQTLNLGERPNTTAETNQNKNADIIQACGFCISRSWPFHFLELDNWRSPAPRSVKLRFGFSLHTCCVHWRY